MAATIAGPGPLPPAGAFYAAYNITAAQQLTTTPGRLWSVVCNTAGTLTISDSNDAGTGNELVLTMTAGQIVNVPSGWPITSGIYVVSTGGGTFALTYSS